MANIVVTKSGNSIKVDFGVYTSAGTRIDMLKSSFDCRDIKRVDQYSDHVHVVIEGEPVWEVAISAGPYLVVDSVDGVAPVSVSDLYDKISALR